MISVPLLSESSQSQLQQEAEHHVYEPEVKVIGTGDRIVKTEYSSFAAFPKTSLYGELAQAFQTLLDQAVATLERYPFERPLQFNSMVLQRYDPGQLGITPHRDSLRAVNLICLFNISGQAKFYRCADRQGTNSIEVDSTPGHVIFLRAPGLMGLSDRPFHYVTDIQTTRYSFGLRQRIEREA